MELPLIGSSKYRKIEECYSKEDMEDKKEVIDSMLPHLKLAKVILGYQYSFDDWMEIKKIVYYEATNHPSLKFNTVLSKFSDHG